MRSKGMALILSMLVGGLGIHHLYLGNYFRGVLYFAFCWTFIPAALGFLDALLILFTSETGFHKRYNESAIKALITQAKA